MHRTFKEEQDHSKVTRADYFMIVFVIAAFAIIFWSAIESLSIADNPREALSARDQPRACTVQDAEVHKSDIDADGNAVTWVDIEQVCM
jgi:predicted transcriptional regulator of viral defense system